MEFPTKTLFNFFYRKEKHQKFRETIPQLLAKANSLKGGEQQSKHKQLQNSSKELKQKSNSLAEKKIKKEKPLPPIGR